MRSLCGLLLGASLLAPGCGKVEPFTDASPVDIDAEDHDAEVSREIQIRTRTRNAVDAVAPSIDVFVTEADGSFGEAGVTDAAGELTLEVNPGSTVTAVYVRANGADMVTYVDVEAGDVLTFGRGSPPSDPTPLAPTMRLGWAAQMAGATSYQVNHPCGNTPSTAATDTSVLFSRRANCDQSPFDVYLTARNAAGVDIGWGVQRDVAFVEGSTANLPAWQPMSTISLGVTGLPAEVTNATINASGTFDDGRGLDQAGLNAAPAGGAIAGTQPWTTGGDGIRVVVLLTRSTQFGQQIVLENRPGDATSVTVASPVTMPWAANLIGSAASGDSGSLSWIMDGDGTFDILLVAAKWTRNNGTQTYEWTAMMGPGRTTYSFPTLPTALAAHAPQDTDSFTSFDGGILDYAVGDGYGPARQRGELGIYGSIYSTEVLKIAGFVRPLN